MNQIILIFVFLHKHQFCFPAVRALHRLLGASFYPELEPAADAYQVYWLIVLRLLNKHFLLVLYGLLLPEAFDANQLSVGIVFYIPEIELSLASRACIKH